DGAVELSADEVPAGQLPGRGARVLLSAEARAGTPPGSICRLRPTTMLAAAHTRQHGASMDFVAIMPI
ncbi:hypothetical protein, partial [Burkholderia cenocepacia]|uniref:hypothetical protein n=1 Tax=Burkholderia cenocepacia TaxID=95486 RepID=UPI001C890CF4